MIGRFIKQPLLVKGGKVKIAIDTLVIFLPVFILLFIISILILTAQEKLEMQVYKTAEKSIVNTKLKNIENEIEHIIHDLFILKSNSNLDKLLNGNYKPEILKNLTKDILNVVDFQKSYDQARIIDEKGMEIIRINYNNGNPIAVPQEKLQNKKNRYYFTDAFKLNKNEVFVSPLDLNIENNTIEQPLKPMIRLATPIFDKLGVKRGILLFNFFGDNILTQLDTYANSLVENQLMLLNTEGYWLKGPISKNEWGFMYDDKKDITFSNLYKNAWDKIKNEESLQFETQQGLFTIQTIYPLLKGLKSNNINDKLFKSNSTELTSKKYYWKIVSHVPSKILYAKQNERRKYAAFILALFSISLLYISWKLATAKYSRNKALQSLKISNDTKDKFFSIIAHDLKGPFNSLLGFSNLLTNEIEQGNSSNIKKYSTILNKTLNNTYNFLINLLEWSQSQTNKIEYKPESFLLTKVVEELFNLLSLQAEKKKITLINSVPDNLMIFADKNMLNTVIRNIVSNALKYSNIDGRVAVFASIKNAKLHCSITDNGIGMTKEDAVKLYHLEHTTSTPGTDNEKGTGLGLILCKELIAKHNGIVGVESEIGKGSNFWFEIPNQ